jgi:hypothetical protein
MVEMSAISEARTAASDIGTRRAWLGYETISVVFAVILLVAAHLKAYSFVGHISQQPELKWQESITIGTIGSEFVLAGWILSGVAKVWARRAAIVILSVFICVAGYLLLVGEEDCGCFGPVQVHPGFTVGLDLLMVLLLLNTRISQRERRSRGSRAFWGPAILGLTTALMIPAYVRAALSSTRISTALQVDAAVYDFGELRPEAASALTHEFVLRNVSDRPVHILKTTTSCSCTSAPLPKSELAPNDVIKIPVTAKWSDRDGAQAAFAWIETDEAPGAKLTLKLTATINSPIVVFPSTLDFGDIQPGLSVEKSFQVRTSPNATVTGISASDEFVVIRDACALTGGANELIRIPVQVKVPPREGYYATHVFVSTNYFVKPLPVIVRFHSVGALTPERHSIVLDLSEKDNGADLRSRFFVARHLGNAPIKAAVRPFVQSGLQVAVSNEADGAFVELSCELTRPGDPMAYDVDIRSGEFTCNVRVFVLNKARMP